MIFVCPDGEPQYRETIVRHAGCLRDDGHEFRYFDGPPGDASTWDERLRDADGVLLLLDLPNDAIQRNPSLRVVSFCGTGVRAFVDVDVAAATGVTVCNVPAYGADAVAEHAFALAFAAARSVAQGDRMIRAREWGQSEGLQLRGKTLGVVGAGPIGGRALEIGRALGMSCIFWTRNPTPERERRLGAEYVELPALFERSDLVSIHLAHTPETEGLIGGDLLGRMSAHAVLVNTARGAVLDGGALGDLLEAGRLKAAGLDVFESEPPSPDDPLVRSGRTVLTPHVGFCTPEANDELLLIGIENLRAFAAGKPRNVVN
jgi:phosphoglycerate dehydrogenase-like enzyme